MVSSIVNSFNEVIPGHVHLRNIAASVHDGILAAGGTPMEFNVIGVCDGIGGVRRYARLDSLSGTESGKTGHIKDSLHQWILL